MKQIISKAYLRRSLIAVVIFNLVSAIFVGIVSARNNSLGLPNHLPPYNSYFWLGLFLALVVGGTLSLSMVTLLERRQSALFWTAVAGFGMQIWALGESYAMQWVSWLNILYFSTGTLELILVFSLLGIAPRTKTKTN